MLEEEQHCSFQEAAGPACQNPAEFNIWNLHDGLQTPSCKAHVGDLLGPGENRIMRLNERT
jgi:hypothetical protein